MNRLCKTLLSLTLCICLTVCIIPESASAASSHTVIDLSRKSDFSGKGYFWDYSEKQLTLKNARITGIIDLPAGSDVEILLEGENIITAPEGKDVVLIRDYKGSDREEYFDTFDVLPQGNIKIRSTEGGSLTLKGAFQVFGRGMLTIDNCKVIALCQRWQNGYPSYRSFHTCTDMEIRNGGQLLLDGHGYTKNLVLDQGTLKNLNLHKLVSFDVSGNLDIKKGSVLSLHDLSGKNINSVLNVLNDVTAHPYTEVMIVNTCSHSNSTALDLRHKSRLASLLSDRLHISSGGDEAIFVNNERVDLDLILPKKIRNDYHTELTIYANQWYYTDLYDKDGKIVTEIDYVATEKAADIKRIAEGVEETQLFLKSSLTEKGNVQLTWGKSPGYKVDYYEVFRSTERYSGYGTEPYFSTQSNLKLDYTNTSMEPGTRYYYKVRGVRNIDGKLYYTQWSNKAWRIAR